MNKMTIKEFLALIGLKELIIRKAGNSGKGVASFKISKKWYQIWTDLDYNKKEKAFVYKFDEPYFHSDGRIDEGPHFLLTNRENVGSEILQVLK